MKPKRVFTWHTHGSYLYYLTQTPVEWFLPVGLKKPAYGGRAGTFLWGDNVHEVHVNDLAQEQFDVIIYQDDEQYLSEQYELFTKDQLDKTVKIYIEHDPPQEHPTDTTHLVTDEDVMVIHVTRFNDLMWDTEAPHMVVEHGVTVSPQASYTGTKERGIVVINNLGQRGRRLGTDIYQYVREDIPLDLVGMGSEELPGGVGEIPPEKITEFIGQYRFYFHPIRYTSLGLALCEAMMVGMPVIGVATTELPTVIQNNESGFVDVDLDVLKRNMQQLLDHEELAKEWGRNAQIFAKKRFDITRFTNDWMNIIHKKYEVPSLHY